MTKEQLIGLAGAYGMEVQFERRGESKIRLTGNGTFVDVWSGKKGITIGVYDPKLKRVHFRRKVSPDTLEDALIRVENAQYV